MPLILGAQSAVATGFSVDNSCRFNDGDAVQLYRAVSVEGNRKVWTISFWIKIGNAVGCRLFAQGNTPSQDPSTMFELGASGAMTIFDYRSSTYNFILEPTAKLKDPNAWYHLVMSFDSTPATPSSTSIKFFINGTQQTAFGTETYPAQDFETEINNTTYDFYAAAYDGGNYFDGYMSEFCLIDGTAYDASDFGEFNADSPTIWQPKDVSELTFGTNGFHLDFGDSAALGTDAAGSNNLTATNLAAVDQCTDSPTNNFAVMNRVDNDSSTFSEGNTTLTWTATNKTNKSGLGMTAGKWYAECKCTDINLGVSGTLIGVGTADNLFETYLSATNSGWGYRCQTGYIQNGAGNEAYGDTYTDGDIIGVAIDVDNGYVYMSKNGIWQDSGDPTSGASGTGAANNQPSYGAVLSGTQFFACSSYDTDVVAWNFGNPPFTGTDQDGAKGYGSFEYDPPVGYMALCTKNLGSDGS